VKWQAKINNQDEPWEALIVPDNELSKRKELIGSPLDKK
jgi:hypothetical protein